jgi:hypothetical protein
MKQSQSMCSVHPTEPLKYHCHDCNQYICVYCKLVQHRSHCLHPMITSGTLNNQSSMSTTIHDDSTDLILDDLVQLIDDMVRTSQELTDYIQESELLITKIARAKQEAQQEAWMMMDGTTLYLTEQEASEENEQQEEE